MCNSEHIFSLGLTACVSVYFDAPEGDLSRYFYIDEKGGRDIPVGVEMRMRYRGEETQGC